LLPGPRVLVKLNILMMLVLGCLVSKAQTPSAQSSKSNSSPQATIQQSVVVDAHLTPEEIEDGQINDVYQPVYRNQAQRDYQKAIEQYRSLVIPMAQSAKFEVPRKKFLYLAYSGIGTCEMALGQFKEAEEMYQKTLEYLPASPGVNDSENAVMLRSVGVARMRQQRWKDAEEPLQKAVSVSGEQIILADKLKEDFMRKALTDDYRESQDITLNVLAVVYFREQRYAESLKLLDRAYNQAIAFQAPVTVVKQIVDNGKAISTAAGDAAASAKWSGRSVPSN
jgi:tetratricopeptide (TPR) repeat protein